MIAHGGQHSQQAQASQPLCECGQLPAADTDTRLPGLWRARIVVEVQLVGGSEASAGQLRGRSKCSRGLGKRQGFTTEVGGKEKAADANVQTSTRRDTCVPRT